MTLLSRLPLPWKVRLILFLGAEVGALLALAVLAAAGALGGSTATTPGGATARIGGPGSAVALVLLLAPVVALALAGPLARLLEGPIRGLGELVGAVTETQDYSLRAPKGAGDELGRLVDGVNDVLARMQVRDTELSVARDQAEEASTAKSNFLASMSHELRTPLNAIIGYSEMMLEDPEESGLGAAVEDVKKINAAGKHLLALINDILDLSKIEAGKMGLDCESFDLPSLVREVENTVRPLLKARGNQLTVDCPLAAPPVTADAVKLRQVLLNLLSNASKFTENGRVHLQVRRDREGLGGFMTFRVRDTGIGMTEEQIGRLFQSFSQAEASTSRRFGGTGLGLAISRRYCQMMGGSIEVESEVDVGSTFTVRLPTEVSSTPHALKTA